jgi:hypothetical protein
MSFTVAVRSSSKSPVRAALMMFSDNIMPGVASGGASERARRAVPPRLFFFCPRKNAVPVKIHATGAPLETSLQLLIFILHTPGSL